jgi:MFS family permease
LFDRRPAALLVVSGSAGESFARLNALEGIARSLLVGVIPLLALEALGSKEMVTRAYLFASVLTLAITLNFAALERLLQRRWVVTLGFGCTLIAMMILLFGEGMVMALGIGLQQTAASLFSVCLSLYIMDYIGKKELIYTETRRMLYAGIVWMVGPTLGLWLWAHTVNWLPFALTVFAAAGMLSYFWYLRLGHGQAIKKAKSQSVNVFRIIPRYFPQRAMRIAYWITLSRSIFWVTLFIYGPIYVVEANLPIWVAGGLLSLASALLLVSPLIRRLAGRVGSRLIIQCALLLVGSSLLMLYVVGEPKPIGLLFWVTAALGGVTLDVLGNIPFMRMVKPRERTEMTMIFSTWREGSQLLTPLLVSMVLLFAPFDVFYVLLALLLFGAGITASFLPRRL